MKSTSSSPSLRDLSIFLRSYDLLAPMSFENSSQWSLDPSLIGVRQEAHELLKLWKSSSKDQQSPRQGGSQWVIFYCSVVLMTLLHNHSNYRFYPLSPQYITSPASLYSLSSPPLIVSSLSNSSPNSLRVAYLTIYAALQDSFNRLELVRNLIISSVNSLFCCSWSVHWFNFYFDLSLTWLEAFLK